MVGFWNVNSWSLKKESDNFKMRQQMLQYCDDLDIIGICETYLRNNESLDGCLPGYKWLGHNRKTYHVNARSGSGGVGIFIRLGVFDEYKVEVLDVSYEGLMWIRLSAKRFYCVLLFCVCYLPPIDSSRYVDACDFMDTLLGQIYRYQNDGIVCLMGDFNARCGTMDDYIEGVDEVCMRDIVDPILNQYGELLCDLMLSANMCMLNGRNFIHNDFTSKDASVVDYVLVPHEQLSLCKDFKVIRAHDLFEEAGCVGLFDPLRSLPDHNMLTWSINLTQFQCSLPIHGTPTPPEATFRKFDMSSIPEDFLLDEDIVEQIAQTIEKLEREEDIRKNIGEAYREFCDIVNEELKNRVSNKEIHIKHDMRRQHRHTKKAYWNNHLSEIYKQFRALDKEWAKAKGAHKQRLRVSRNAKRKQLDRDIQKAKRVHWRQMQQNILDLEKENQKEFWKYVGNIGIGAERKSQIPWEVVNPDGSTSHDKDEVLNRWKNDYSDLFNKPNSSQPADDLSGSTQQEIIDTGITLPISRREVELVINRAKNGKACGHDSIYIEALRNDTAVDFLHKLFKKCFDAGITPDMWNRNIINPIPKGSDKDPRIPLNYRGISLGSVVCKLYASILNQRLGVWADVNKKIDDSQNGFRKGRSCQDQLSTLTSIIDARKRLNKDTITSFIDFSKAYDRIDRHLLWNSMKRIGLPQKFISAVQSLYQNVEYSVRINGILTDWFPVSVGLKQGCTISPTLFNVYINSLVSQIKESRIGVDIDGDIIAILLYADDIVLIAESKEDLQRLLNILHHWCQQYAMSVNIEKSKVVHFRKGPSIPRSEGPFCLGDKELEVVEKYRYLGLVITEYLDMNVTAKSVSQAAHRALGMLIAKGRAHGSFPYEVFTKLYNSLVQPIIDYGACIWGYRSYTCIEAVQNRALRYFLRVGKRTPIAAMQGDMGWSSQEYRQWVCISRQWCRLSQLEENRLNKKVFQWAYNISVKGKRSIMSFISKFYHNIDMDFMNDIESDLSYISMKTKIDEKLKHHFNRQWDQKVNQERARRGNGRNKLRVYAKFKKSYECEPYLKMNISMKYRQALSKFRFGVAPLRIETGRYVGESEENRLCQTCKSNEVENEEHCLTRCDSYVSIRQILYNAATKIDNNFQNKSDTNKLYFILSNPDIASDSAKACHNILLKRSQLLHK